MRAFGPTVLRYTGAAGKGSQLVTLNSDRRRCFNVKFIQKARVCGPALKRRQPARAFFGGRGAQMAEGENSACRAKIVLAGEGSLLMAGQLVQGCEDAVAPR